MKEVSAGNQPLTAFHLKAAALITMIIDHTAAVFSFPPFVNSLMRGIGRMAFPIYAFLIAEGCRYTRSREKYLLRLGVFALISEIPFDAAFFPGTVRLGWNFFQLTNVFYTMFFAAACIHIWETLRRQSGKVLLAAAGAFAAFLVILPLLRNAPRLWMLAAFAYLACLLAACLLLDRRSKADAAPDRKAGGLAAIPLLPVLILADTVQCDYNGFGVLLIFLLYLAKNRRVQAAVLAAGMFFLYGLGSGLNLVNWIISGFSELPTLHGVLAFAFAMLAAGLVCFYNGRRGRPVKWAFYAAYPVHLAVLAALRAYLSL
ncbi:MAG: conjugal transfer protein TraX [Oscillospiraceae bacterium]|nr:conjugal transfer protein TraX [Oscillospiraceae bacterium]